MALNSYLYDASSVQERLAQGGFYSEGENDARIRGELERFEKAKVDQNSNKETMTQCREIS
jgi:hypothetical protein